MWDLFWSKNFSTFLFIHQWLVCCSNIIYEIIHFFPLIWNEWNFYNNMNLDTDVLYPILLIALWKRNRNKENIVIKIQWRFKEVTRHPEILEWKTFMESLCLLVYFILLDPLVVSRYAIMSVANMIIWFPPV